MKISLIIPAYNESKYLGRCLESVSKNKRDCLKEIIVVDNASTDDTAAVASAVADVRVVREEKKGLTRAREKGLLESSGDILAYVDADTVMPDGWVDTVFEEFSKDENLVCLSGPYRYYDISKAGRFGAALYWIFVAFPCYFLVGYMVVGGNFAARREALERIGGFDQNISFYGEDTNIARRLRAAGKVKFKLSFFMNTSGRRLNSEGLLITALRYGSNFLSEVILKRPLSRAYKDIR